MVKTRYSFLKSYDPYFWQLYCFKSMLVGYFNFAVADLYHICALLQKTCVCSQIRAFTVPIWHCWWETNQMAVDRGSYHTVLRSRLNFYNSISCHSPPKTGFVMMWLKWTMSPENMTSWCAACKDTIRTVTLLCMFKTISLCLLRPVKASNIRWRFWSSV